MSTTCAGDVARQYAEGDNAMILEIEMGSSGRGADLSRVSQYVRTKASSCRKTLEAEVAREDACTVCDSGVDTVS